MKIHVLQALRALAAWLVVSDHALLAISRDDPSSPLTRVAWALGDTGVYMFFAISGFIMVVISWKDFGQPGAASTFLGRRITRVAPLYWLATLGAVNFHVFSGSQGFDSHQLIRSFLFVPPVVAGRLVPVLQQGWTLTYEMMFYGFFAGTLMLKRSVALPVLASALFALVVSQPFLPAGFLTALASPIVLWFVLGIAIGYAWRFWRLTEPQWVARNAKTLEFFGDASYSTYLAHGMALTLLTRVWVHIFGHPSYGFIPVTLVVATAVGCLTHVAVERPLLRVMLRGQRRRMEHAFQRSSHEA